MLAFVGRNSAVPSQVALDSDEFTIGRDPKCSLVLDSTTSPRMISRVHAKLTRSQPASPALLAVQRSASRAASRLFPASTSPLPAPQPFQPRWLLTDPGSVNGLFVNDVKVTSTLLSHGDTIVIGGLGMKVPVGTSFPQPEAEFIFTFLQPGQALRPLPLISQDATLPIPAAEDEERKYAVDEEYGEAPTQLLPSEPALSPSPRVAERRPSLRKKSSSDMVDATFVELSAVVSAPRTRSRASASPPAAAVLPRTFSSAPTQHAGSEASVPMQVSQTLEIHVVAPAAPMAAALLHAYRPMASIDASMADHHDASISASLLGGSEEGRPALGRSMSVDSADTSQAATQLIGPGGVPAASISASLLGDLDGMGMHTQTQVLDIPVSASPLKPVSRKESTESQLYDGEEVPAAASSAAAAAAAAVTPMSVSASHIMLVSPSPAAAAAAAAAKLVTPVSKKRDRRSFEPDTPEEEVEVVEVQPDSENAHKRPRFGRKASDRRSAAVVPAAAAASSSAAAAAAAPSERCPVCDNLCAASELQAHVEACLRVAASEADEAAARKLANELDVAEATARGGGRGKAARSPKKKRTAAAWAIREAYSDDGADSDDASRGYGYDRSSSDHESDAGEEEPPWRAAAAWPAAAAAAAPARKLRKPAAASAAAAAASGPKAPCPLCSKLFLTSALAEHADVCEGADELCPKCNQGFLPSQLATHKRNCKGPPSLCAICEEYIDIVQFEYHISRCVGKDGRACTLCGQLCPASELEAHSKRCAEKEVELSQDEKFAIQMQRGEQERSIVNDMQTRAIQWVAMQAEKLSTAAYKPLLARMEKMGHSERELKATIRYIRNDAPLIIHVNLTNCMKFFLKDTHYRNQFETKTSCGTLSASARTQWENGLFNHIYAKASGYERVKVRACASKAWPDRVRFLETHCCFLVSLLTISTAS
jgi:hypothetical protein